MCIAHGGVVRLTPTKPQDEMTDAGESVFNFRRIAHAPISGSPRKPALRHA